MGASAIRQSGRTVLVIAFCVFLTTSPVAGIGLSSPSDTAQQSAVTDATAGQTDFTDVNASELEGSGTPSDPYNISNVSELQAMEDELDAHYELVSDIDASNTSTWKSGNGFAPIGDDSREFVGTLDGNGYNIDQLSINRSSTSRVGLFGRTDNATIRDVTLTEANITGHKRVGALVGYSHQTTVHGASATGHVSGNESVGGLLGYNNGHNSLVTQSTANANVTATFRMVGSLVGGNDGNATIRQSIATGSVDGGDLAGGLTGLNDDNSTILNTYATTNVNGSSSIGGLVGVNIRNGTIHKSYATGSVSGSGNSIGGLVGNNINSSVTASYWNTQTTGQSQSAGEATALTTVNMTGEAAESNMSALAFGDVWETQPDDYPVLAWQLPQQGGEDGAPGPDLVVDGEADGDDEYATIQNGIDNASEGDIVEVRPGTYEEPIDVSKNISLIAPGGANITNSSAVPAAYGTAESQQGLQIEGPATPQIAGFRLINWTVGVDATSSEGDWTVLDTQVRGAEDGIVAENASGAWAIERSLIADSASEGVEASNTTGEWTIRFTEIVDARRAVEATSTTGAWEIRWSALVNSSEITIDARGAEIGGNATRNWWGDPDGPGDNDIAGNVSVAEPLPVPPTTILGTLSAESGASLAGDSVVAYTDLDGEETEVFDAGVAANGEFRIDTDRPGVSYTLAYADDDFGEERNGVPDLYAIGKTIAPEHVDPELPTAHNVSIRVIDQYGNPIENADLAIEHRNGGAVIADGERDATDENGYLSVDGETTFEFVGNLTVGAAFSGVNGSTNVQVDSDQTITVELSGATVNGTINTSSGSPEGDLVGAFNVTDDGVEGVDTTVGADGSFELGGLSSDEEYTLVFGDDDAGDVSNDVPDIYAVQRVSPAAGTTDVGEIDIPEAQNVSVRVVDRTGEPIQGADVAITHKNGDAVVEDGERDATNGSGYFSPAGSVPIELAGNVTVWANYNGVNNSTSLRVNKTTGDRSVVIELTRPDVSGSLSAENGASLENDSIGIFSETDQGDIEGIDSIVDADGNFTLSGGSADKNYTLTFSDNETGSPNGVPDLYAIQRVSPPEDVGEVTIPEAHNVSVRVVKPGEYSDDPIEDADVSISHRNGSAIIEEGVREGTNESGYLVVNGSTSLEFVGNVSVWANYNGFSNTTNVNITRDRTVVVELPGYGVDGTVTDSDGQPVPNATLSYGALDERGIAFYNDAITADGGTYRTDLLPAAYSVEFVQRAPSVIGSTAFPVDGVPDVYAAEPTIVDGPTQNDLTLPEAHRLRVRVVDQSGDPITGKQLGVTHVNGNSDASLSSLPRTNETGWINFSDTSAVEVVGRVALDLKSDQYVARETIEVTSDRTYVLEAKETVNVTGNVTDANSDLVTNGTVFARATDESISANAPIKENGEYELSLAANTTYELGFRQDGEGSEVNFPTDGIPDIQSLTVIETGSVDERLPEQQLGVGHPVDITVENPDGTNASGVTVSVSDNNVEEDFGLGAGGETNENGSFVLYGADEPGIELNGSIDIYVDPPEGSGLADANRRDIVIDESRDITIQLETAVTVSGTVLEPNGVTPAVDERIQVNAAEEDRRAGDTVRTDESGFFDAQVPAEGAYHVGFVQAEEGTATRPPYPADGVPDFYAIDTVTSDEEADLGSVTLPEPHNLTVNVVDSNDQLVENATVRLWSTANDAYQWGGETTVADGSLTVEVNGSVGIQGIAPDDVDLRSEYEQIEVTGDDTINVTLDPNVTVSGSVDYANGENVTGYSMGLFGDGGDSRLTDENGTFDLFPRPNQTYPLGFKQTDGDGGQPDFPKDGRPDLHAFRIVEVGAEDQNVGDLTLPEGHLVNITVENASGEPVPDAAVDINAISGFAGPYHPGTTSGDGKVVLNGSEAPGVEVNGTLRVQVRQTGPYASNASIYEVDGDREVTIVLRERVNVSGRLVNESGAGLTGFDLVASESDGVYNSAFDRSNETGNFSIPVGANETYSITAGQREAETDTIGVRDGVTDLYELAVVETGPSDVVIDRQTVPPAAGILNVTVENESGIPVEDAVVSIIPNQSGVADVSSVQLARSTDQDGYFVVGDKRGIEAAGEYAVRVSPPDSEAFVDDVNVTTVNVTDGDETVNVVLNESDTGTTDPQSDISIQSAILRENAITVGDEVIVDATLENLGEANGTATVELGSEDQTISVSETISVPAGGAATTDLRTTVQESGEYTLTVSTADDSTSVGTVNVTASPEPANVTLTNASVSPKVITAGETVQINATVENTGDAEGTISLAFYSDGSLIIEREVNVSADSTRVLQVEQPYPDRGDGQYNITVASQSDDGRTEDAGTVIVEREETETGTGAPGFGFAPAIVALLGVIFVLRRR